MHRQRLETPEGEMASIDFGDPAQDMAALWLHATGFNAMTYQSLLAPLGQRHRVTALDMRGHGRTTLPADPKTLKSWNVYRDDVIEFLEKTAAGPVVLGGHSMGGCVAMLVAGKRPDLVKGLVLVDPVVLSKRFYLMAHVLPFLKGGNAMGRQARKRRSSFTSPKAAMDAYRGKGAFRTWREPFLEDYLLDGLTRIEADQTGSPERSWRLACAPKWEAATFNSQRNQPWGALKAIREHDLPIVIFRPGIKAVMSDKVTARMVAQYPALVLRERPNATHFHPMEAPFEVRDELARNISYLIEGYSGGDDGHTRRSLHYQGWTDEDN